MPTKKGLAVWILGFCTFVVALTTFHAMLLLTQYGQTATLKSSLLGQSMEIQALTYFMTSLIVTCILFGATSFAAFRYSLEFETLIKLNSVLNHNTKQLITLLDENKKAMDKAKKGLSEKIEQLEERLNRAGVS